MQPAQTQEHSQLSGAQVKSSPSPASAFTEEVDRMRRLDPDLGSLFTCITAKGHCCERW